jgi:hypothetical protein
LNTFAGYLCAAGAGRQRARVVVDAGQQPGSRNNDAPGYPVSGHSGQSGTENNIFTQLSEHTGEKSV